MTVGRM
jgi:hypothetical protein